MKFECKPIDEYLVKKYRVNPNELTNIDKEKILDDLSFNDLKYDGYITLLESGQQNIRLIKKCEKCIERIEKIKSKETKINHYINYLLKNGNIEKSLEYFEKIQGNARKLEICARLSEHANSMNNKKVQRVVEMKLNEIIESIDEINDKIDSLFHYSIWNYTHKILIRIITLIENIENETDYNDYYLKVLEVFKTKLSKEEITNYLSKLNKDYFIKYELNELELQITYLSTRNIERITNKIKSLYNSNESNCKSNENTAKKILVSIILGLILFKYQDVNEYIKNKEEIMNNKVTKEQINDYIKDLKIGNSCIKYCYDCYIGDDLELKSAYLSLRCPQCKKSLNALSDYHLINDTESNGHTCYWCGRKLTKENYIPKLVCKECSEHQDRNNKNRNISQL